MVFFTGNTSTGMFPLYEPIAVVLVLINLVYEFQTRTMRTVKEVRRLGLFLGDSRKCVDWSHLYAGLTECGQGLFGHRKYQTVVLPSGK